MTQSYRKVGSPPKLPQYAKSISSRNYSQTVSFWATTLKPAEQVPVPEAPLATAEVMQKAIADSEFVGDVAVIREDIGLRVSMFAEAVQGVLKVASLSKSISCLKQSERECTAYWAYYECALSAALTLLLFQGLAPVQLRQRSKSHEAKTYFILDLNPAETGLGRYGLIRKVPSMRHKEYWWLCRSVAERTTHQSKRFREEAAALRVCNPQDVIKSRNALQYHLPVDVLSGELRCGVSVANSSCEYLDAGGGSDELEVEALRAAIRSVGVFALDVAEQATCDVAHIVEHANSILSART